MLNPDLARMRSPELADPSRIPQFTGDAEIFAAADERVGAASFCRGRNAVGGEVVLFAAGDGDQSI